MLGSDASFETGAIAVFEIGGTTPSAEYDQLSATGELALAEILEVELVNLGGGLFVPHNGDTFNILDWGSLAGSFETVNVPPLGPDLMWDKSALCTTGILSVVPKPELIF